MPGFLADVLSREQNYGLTLAIETALEMKLPPTALLFTDKQPTDPWDQTDKKIAIAMHVLGKQTCPKCGQPLWVCRSDDSNLDFSVKTGVCYATKALEDRQSADEKRKKTLKPGEFYYVEPKMLFDAKRPSRAAWIESLKE